MGLYPGPVSDSHSNLLGSPEERGETMGICFHNAGKCDVVTGTNFDEEGPFNQGVLIRLFHSPKHQHLLIEELDTKLCHCHPFGEDL